MQLSHFLDVLHFLAAPFIPALLCIIVAEIITFRSGRRRTNALWGFLAGLGIWLLDLWAEFFFFYKGELWGLVVLFSLFAFPILLGATIFETIRQSRKQTS